MFLEEIICAGFGGQGIMVMGKVLAYAGMLAGYDVTYFPSYGAEVRGGTAYSMVIINKGKIASPIVELASVLFIMNQASLEKFSPRIKNGGLIILNSSMIDSGASGIQNSIRVSATDIAHKLGNAKMANVVMIGAYLAKSKVLSRRSVVGAFQALAPSGREDLIELNERALVAGMEAQ